MNTAASCRRDTYTRTPYPRVVESHDNSVMYARLEAAVWMGWCVRAADAPGNGIFGRIGNDDRPKRTAYAQGRKGELLN